MLRRTTLISLDPLNRADAESNQFRGLDDAGALSQLSLGGIDLGRADVRARKSPYPDFATSGCYTGGIMDSWRNRSASNRDPVYFQQTACRSRACDCFGGGSKFDADLQAKAAACPGDGEQARASMLAGGTPSPKKDCLPGTGTDRHRTSESNRALALVASGRLDEARLVAARAVQQDPRDWHAHYAVGQCFRFDQDYPSACAALSRANKLAPQESQVLLALGIAHQLNAELSRTSPRDFSRL